MEGGEVFLPKLKATTVQTIAEAVTYPEEPRMTVTGLRPGEKHSEVLVGAHEGSRTLDRDWHYLITPLVDPHDHDWGGMPVKAGFQYASHAVEQLDVAGFRQLAGLKENWDSAFTGGYNPT